MGSQQQVWRKVLKSSYIPYVDLCSHIHTHNSQRMKICRSQAQRYLSHVPKQVDDHVFHHWVVCSGDIFICKIWPEFKSLTRHVFYRLGTDGPWVCHLTQGPGKCHHSTSVLKTTPLLGTFQHYSKIKRPITTEPYSHIFPLSKTT